MVLLFEIVLPAKSLLGGGILFITTFGNEVEQVMPSIESPVKFFAKFNWWFIQLPYWFKASFSLFFCFWNFTLLETQKIIIHEVRLNPREVRLTEVRFNEPPK